MASSSSTSPSVKRKLSPDIDPVKPQCKYGSQCYRKNPRHWKEYSHPADTSATSSKRRKVEACGYSTNDRGFYLTTVKGIDNVFNDRSVAIGIEDILSDGCDGLVESVQFNYMFDLSWLLDRYPKSARCKPLLLVHGHTGKDKTDLEGEAMEHSNVDLVQAKLPIPYGTHHSKMMLLLYETGVKVVIHTANLIQQDWHQKTQGVWISPLFIKVAGEYSSEKDSFKLGLLEYLSSYGSTKLSKFVDKLKEYDMSTANVQLVASVPGRHIGKSMQKWGHLKLKQLLSQHGPSLDEGRNSFIVGQFSSIGSLGADSSNWLTAEWLDSLATCKDGKVGGKNLKLIYPTINNVRDSLEGYSAGGSLPYGVQLAMKQRYLKGHLQQWKADHVGRSLASPHIKSYARISQDNETAAWFLLTSANLSKAAWGVYEKNKTQYMIRSYEIGVLFTRSSKAGSNDQNWFTLETTDDTDSQREYFQLPFDVPLTPYDAKDKPWVWDIKYTKEDSHGRLWIPR